jgi:hypothetical protein
MTGENHIDVDSAQQAKHGQFVSGDVFLSQRLRQEGRVITVLSDGLGSGVKASVLANLTATMALKYTASFVDVRQSARTIMDTLPICEVRKISYSTFTIVDMDAEGHTRVIEHGNPPFLLLRGARELSVDKASLTLDKWKDRVISYCEFQVQLGDRIVCFSDGVSQSGLGQKGMPLGWRQENVVRYVASQVHRDPEMSSLRLAGDLVARSLSNDGGLAKDDITCACLTFRRPRRLLVLTGPPVDRARDSELAQAVQSYPGRKVICGGTTASLVARELSLPVAMDLSHLDPDVPPASRMKGVDLITEGTITLAKVAEALEAGAAGNGRRKPCPHPIRALIDLMLESDIVEFIVGTRINEAHQDPNVPVELDLRRNIVRRILALLEGKYLKRGTVRFV